MKKTLFYLGLIFLCSVSLFSQATKVGGTGKTKVGGTGKTKVAALVSSVTISTDTFIRANIDPISNPMSDGVSTWSQSSLDSGTTGTVQIFSNHATGSTSGDNFAKVLTPSYTSDQYARFTVVFQGGTEYDGPCVRIQPGSSDCYFAYFNAFATDIKIAKRISGSNTILQTITLGVGPSAGDTVTLGIHGTTLTVSVNGVPQSPTATDATLTGGQPGIYINSTNTDMDTFTCGPN